MTSSRLSRVAVLAASLALAAGLLGSQGPAAAAAADPAAAAAARLRAEATRSLTAEEGADATLEFAGAQRGAIDNPTVSGDDSVDAAARKHLSRYGRAFGKGVTPPNLVRTGTFRNAAGQDVVRYKQEIEGLPVLGGEVVVSLRKDRQLGSIAAETSDITAVPATDVTEREAAVIARGAVTKGVDGRVDVESAGRWIVDPAVSGLPSITGTRVAWRFEVSDGAAVRRMVLVDAGTGQVLAEVDLLAHLDRVICDNDNVRRAKVESCTTDFARVEGQPATGQHDVDSAYEHVAATSDFYEQIGGPDLTALLGVDVGGRQKLASTVRFCSTASTYCPHLDAFWNGEQAVFGEGFAGADDVVAHELTHGVIEKSSALFPWGQSGAINESMADVMGEIVDRRHDAEGDDPDSWTLGEDLPIGELRDLADPTQLGDPDKMTSSRWYTDLGVVPYGDRGGIHFNSGVGNKTFFLISQGGTFNGRTVTGIDGDDATLTKSAMLYLGTLFSLTSGSDYADLGRTLVQTCHDFVVAGAPGMTASDCLQIQAATEATELALAPAFAPAVKDASATCPAGTTKRVLLDGESGDPQATFTAGALWGRAPRFAPANAISGTGSWFGKDPDPTLGDPYQSSLTATDRLTVPTGQKTYLHFQQWRVFEWTPAATPRHWDGGTLEIDTGTAAPTGTADLEWANGPEDVLDNDPSAPNPSAGLTAFAGDSFGWIGSRLDLSTFAGKQIRPTFTVRGDARSSYVGWYLDDIVVYTCDVPAVVTNVTLPKVSGTGRFPDALAATAGTWVPAAGTRTFQWLRNGAPITNATRATYQVTTADLGKNLTVRVTAVSPGYSARAVTSAPVTIRPGRLATVRPTIRGKARVGKVLVVRPGSWGSGVRLRQQWYRNGKAIRGATAKKYRLTRKDRGKRLSVRVTATKAGYATASRTSAKTAKVRR